ncbi:HD domain-containing protein [Deinococcus yavapaiensis]|uniref:Putative nucleotidyltransferase with HDIG domain n=1 Tax=Deinococcus yavapaiensis KR-236 TaxID=694435 RepID=A0A318S771_9DEIO|nr:HD domain-containing protein [Deinococcus yavapaiensis]PYE54816.1 putative nucleotidyltransferase with HDIG domain [Deinococcus yavapaiensis KR-236]
MAANLLGKIARLARSLHASRARPDDAFAARFLQGGEGVVYLAMDPRDREHACRVARTLLTVRPDAPPHLVAAALLHDCGKSTRPYRVAERVLAGLVPMRFAARLPVGFVQVRARHARLGASMLQAVNARPEVIRLVERHHTPDDGDARLLHDLDDLE